MYGRNNIKKALQLGSMKKKIKAREVNTVKIEADVAENEQQSLLFYKKHGFKVEGKLQDHFRAKEMVYVIGKMVK